MSYRVNELTTAGEMVRQCDLSKGFYFEDGLFGLSNGYLPDGTAQILIQLDNADNSMYYLLPDSPEGSPKKLPGRPVFGAELQMQSGSLGELAALSIGGQDYESSPMSRHLISWSINHKRFPVICDLSQKRSHASIAA